MILACIKCGSSLNIESIEDIESYIHQPCVCAHVFDSVEVAKVKIMRASLRAIDEGDTTLT